MSNTQTKSILSIFLITATSVFTYAILYSSLSLLFTETLGLSKHQSNSVVAIFIAFNFMLHLVAGFVGERLIPYKRLLAIALTFQCLGGVILAFDQSLFLIMGLCFFLIGSGFSPTCLNCLLAEQFDKNNQTRREKAFFINYSALNFGFFLGFLTSGYYYSLHNLNFILQITLISSLLSLIIYVVCQKHIQSSSQARESILYRSKGFILGATCIVFTLFMMFLGFNFENHTNAAVLSLSALALLYIGLQAQKMDLTSERQKIYAYFVFTLAAIIFWTLYFIGPMGFVFFLKNNVQHVVLNYPVSPQWIMNIESILVIVCSPLLAYLFQYLEKKRIEIPLAKKFSFALLMIATSFLMLWEGILHADAVGLVSVSWITLYYFFQAIGELLIAPVGYAMIGKLAPTQLQGIMMGLWMTLCGVASILSHHVSNAMTNLTTDNPLVTNTNYLLVFSNLGVYAFIAGSVLFLFSRRIDIFAGRVK